MAQKQIIPTRMELTRLKKRLVTARRGHKLLKDKRDELMKLFLEAVREDKRLRIEIEKKLSALHGSFSVASSVTGREMLEEALIYPKTEGELSVDYKNVMSVTVPEYTYTVKDAGNNPFPYGFAFTSGELDCTVEELREMLPDLLRLAEVEKRSQMLADEIEKTRRRVNALEYIMIPQFETGIKAIMMKLDENDRGNTTRLMKVKDMVLAENYGKSK